MISADTSLIGRVERTVRRQRLFTPGATLIVALSGGADSTLLLDLLTRLPGYNLRLIAAHLNHSLRGAESDADEEFCRLLASRYRIPFESRRTDVSKLAADLRMNLEDAGRRARIRFLDEVAMKYGGAVALAHHADDQAETVLMRLLRGSGMTGLSGMSHLNARGYLRPLLEVTRAEIERYLRAHGMEWREDASNRDTIYLRNRIRHELLPLLEGYNPAIRSSLASTASIIGGDEALLAELTEAAFAGSCGVVEEGVVSSVAGLRALNPALRRRVLRRAFKQLAGTMERLGQRHIDALCDLIDSARPNSRVALPQAVTAVREYDRLLLTNAEKGEGGADFELLITAPGRYLLPLGGSISVESMGPAEFTPDSGSPCFDLARSPLPWLVRTFRPGDRITPFGMSGSKKVKDVFIDRKIPPSERRRIPLLFCGDDLLWVAAVCVSELSRIDTPPAAALRVRWQP